MPTYFFETTDGEDVVDDDIGQRLPNDLEARKAAIAALPEMALDALPDGNSHNFQVVARDVQGRVIYKATLTFHGEWGEDRAHIDHG